MAPFSSHEMSGPAATRHAAPRPPRRLQRTRIPFSGQIHLVHPRSGPPPPPPRRRSLDENQILVLLSSPFPQDSALPPSLPRHATYEGRPHVTHDDEDVDESINDIIIIRASRILSSPTFASRKPLRPGQREGGVDPSDGSTDPSLSVRVRPTSAALLDPFRRSPSASSVSAPPPPAFLLS